MNIYKYAMKMEKDGEKFYRNLAHKTNNPGLQNILNMLADEEVKHCKVLEKLSKNSADADLAESGILTHAENIFKNMHVENLDEKPDPQQTALYRKAQEIEDESYKFYMEKSKTAENPTQRKIFLKLAEEEKKHMHLMENIVEFLLQPKLWIENAEFHHMGEY